MDPVNQINFSSAGATELSTLNKLEQLEIVQEIEAFTPEFVNKHPEKFGQMQQGDRTLYRFRFGEHRIYFELLDRGLSIQRVLNANTLQDFLFRSNLPLSEDESLQQNPSFWEFIDAEKKS